MQILEIGEYRVPRSFIANKHLFRKLRRSRTSLPVFQASSLHPALASYPTDISAYLATAYERSRSRFIEIQTNW